MLRLLGILVSAFVLTATLQEAAAESVPLSRFTSTPGPLRLTDANKAVDLFVPVAGTVMVEDATLSLRYVNSVALLGGRSVLTVRLNEATLAQIPLRPDQPQGRATVRLPSDLWRAGYNKVTLAVTQHYTDRCEDPEAPELWTEIDLAASDIDMDLLPVDRPYVVGDLSGLFSPGFGGQSAVALHTAPGADDAVRMEALPLVAQALAARREFAPLKVTTEVLRTPSRLDVADAPFSTATPGQADVQVLVGTVAELAPLLADRRLDGISGPTLVMDGRGPRARLLVTGPQPADVVTAARNLGRIEDQVNAAGAVAFREAAPAPAPVLPRRLTPGATYTFADLGTASTTVNDSGVHGISVRLPLPPDFYTYEGALGELLLDFGYGAGNGPGSVMNVKLNGEFIHGLLMDAPNGSAFRTYRIALPARLLRRGDNDLTFTFTLRPPLGVGECASVKGRHLTAQLLGSSTFTVPPAGSATILPDLSLLSASGFPFAGGATGGGAPAIFIGDESLRGAALTLAGRVSQAAGTTVPWRVVAGIPASIDGPAIVLAAAEDLDATLFKAWTGSLGKVAEWPYPALQTVRQASIDIRSAGTSAMSLFGLAAAPAAAPGGTLTQEGALGELAVMTAVRNPWTTAPETLAIITAEDDATLARRIDDLVSPAIWGRMAGDLTVWDGSDMVFTQAVAQPYAVASDDAWLWLRIVLSNNPLWWIAAAAGAVLLIVVSAAVLLSRRVRKLAERD